MLMPVAMVIGVNEWLLWCPPLAILGGENFDVCVCSLNLWEEDDKGRFSIINENVQL